MLKVRVIPTLLWKDYGLVKGVGFESWRRVGSALPAIKVYNARDIDELILLDISASQQQIGPDVESMSEFSLASDVPVTVGGGIKSLDQIVTLLHSGADKISINTEAYCQPELINEAAKRFGSQCVLGSIDVRRMDSGEYRCFSHSGAIDTGRDAVEWAKELASRGAGEILLTSIERDGTMRGYDMDIIELISAAVDIPVIASGGAGNYQHMIDAVIQAGASAVAAASLFHFTEQTPAGAKLAMHTAGIAVRINHMSTV